MEPSFHYSTVSESSKYLRSKGYVLDFNLEENCISGTNCRFTPHQFEIVEVYRYEGNMDADFHWPRCSTSILSSLFSSPTEREMVIRSASRTMISSSTDLNFERNNSSFLDTIHQFGCNFREYLVLKE